MRPQRVSAGKLKRLLHRAGGFTMEKGCRTVVDTMVKEMLTELGAKAGIYADGRRAKTVSQKDLLRAIRLAEEGGGMLI
jgi:histone H3/H4